MWEALALAKIKKKTGPDLDPVSGNFFLPRFIRRV